jgi:hypothetical protein
LSSGQFCRAFKCTFGMPAHVYLMHRRIEVAQGLMLRTNAPLSEIALRCGMSDQAHFTRTFRRVVGETPCLWRRTRRNAMLDQQIDVTGVRQHAIAAVVRSGPAHSAAHSAAHSSGHAGHSTGHSVGQTAAHPVGHSTSHSVAHPVGHSVAHTPLAAGAQLTA